MEQPKTRPEPEFVQQLRNLAKAGRPIADLDIEAYVDAVDCPEHLKPALTEALQAARLTGRAQVTIPASLAKRLGQLVGVNVRVLNRHERRKNAKLARSR
jgi:hypothetical protein